MSFDEFKPRDWNIGFNDWLGERKLIRPDQRLHTGVEAVDEIYEKTVDDLAEVFYAVGEAKMNKDKQVGGEHYKNSNHQPLQIVLDNEGYLAFRGACLTKIYKYIGRQKDDRLEDFKKAQHILDWLIEETEK